ncbi:zf-HC2 domain-containing protein [Mucilaginibacter celer]|uniref:HEAT repeat domain-containing protein n=1 Tax=Mucilaginibacter celer TaxID=2305508 RepID=A0A494W713_9SPHI|nr:zf-HC2 domain-containing protein [Mucilaginibacter celer]AYL99338.1 HEAT repeat domain-containing protein [Mucilaginibacter celer]
MKCELYEELFTGWINKELSTEEKGVLERHIAGCDNCREELLGLQKVWDTMGEVETPEPSANMGVKFYAMLDTYKQSVKEQRSFWADVKYHIGRLWEWQPRWPMAYNFVMILIVAGAGYLFFGKGKADDQDKQLKALSSQVHELKQTMMLALLENPSASERIRGVSYTGEIKHADKQVIDALLATLNNDPNVNVRLSTLDALTHLAGRPEVREGLIKSIIEQDSPLMQLAIADVMLKLQEKRSVGSFKELLKQKDLDNGVRNKIKQTITQLI